MLLAGCAGLFVLHRRRHPQHGDAAAARWTWASSRCCSVTSLTGLALWPWRARHARRRSAAGAHLGVVMALFA
jgi:citrate/tricarballylate utilization protein